MLFPDRRKTKTRLGREHRKNAGAGKPGRFSPQTLEKRDLLAARIAGSSTSYSTIQAAVNAAAPGATIDVDAGNYAEKVTITKNGLTLRGAQAGVDARTNARAAAVTAGKETILTGATISTGVVSCAFYVNAKGVTIDGFTVQGESYKNSDVGAGIVLAPSIAGTHILNNIVQRNYAGMFLSNNSDVDACVIQHNVFRDNYNPNDTQGYAYSGNDNRSIYTDGGVSGGKLTNVTIDANAFYYDLVPPDYVEGAIGLECYTSGAQTNIRVTNNTFDGIGKVILYYNVDGLTATGNTITHVGDVWTGVFRDEGHATNVTIQYNNVYDSYGPVLRIDNRAVSGNSGNYHFNNNNLVNCGYSVHGGISFQSQTGVKAGVYVDPGSYHGTLDLTGNWWGDASGPSGKGYSGTGTGIASESTTPVDCAVGPWLAAPAVAVEQTYLGATPTDGAPVQAEFFNHGPLGVAYYNTSATSPGGAFRKGETVGVISATDVGSGGDFAVGKTAAGNWIDYLVNITSGGTFRLDLRYLSTAAAAMHVAVDGAALGGTIALANTSSKWTTFGQSGLALSTGTHLVRLFFDSGSPTLNWFQFTNQAAVAPTPVASLAAAPLSPSSVLLTWGNASTSGQTGSKVQRSLDGVTWTTVATVTGNEYIDASLAAGTTYRFRVLATGPAGDASTSDVVTATTFSAATLPQYLSDFSWSSASSGYGTVQKGRSIAGNAITLNGVAYGKGLGTHASSTIVYSLGGAYSRFTSAVGLDAEIDAKGNGSVQFQVLGDGKVLFDSGVLRNDQVANVDVSVAGVQTLQLVVLDGGDGIDFDHADWAGAALYGAPTAPAAAAGLVAKLTTSTGAALTWSAGSINTTGYDVQRSIDGVTFTTIASVTTTSYADAGPLAAGTTYTYRVVATNAQGSAAASVTASVKTAAAGTVVAALSSLTPTTATTGYGSVQANKSVAGNTIKIGGVAYASGVGVHAVSKLTYNLAGQWTTFASDVGVDDEVVGKGTGSVIFQVIGDGKVLFDSGALTNGQVAKISVSVAGVQTLVLVATNGIAGTVDYDHADWAGATLTGTPSAPSAPTALAASALTSSSVKLTWAAPVGSVASYAVDRSADNGVTWTIVNASIAGTATSWIDPTALAANTTYAYRLRATNAAGPSANSAVATVKTPAQQTATALSSLAWTSATAGWGTPQTNASVVGNAITVAGQTYATGIGTHTNSEIVYDITGKGYTAFTSTVGIDDEAKGSGIARFQVWGDGVLLYDSGLLGNGQSATFSVAIAGVKQLKLVASSASGTVDDIDYGHADWAGATLLA